MTARATVRTTRTVLALALAVSVTGCSSALVGNWKTDPTPTGVSFYIKHVQFKDDGTFAAVAKKGDENTKLAGTYDFNGFNLKLKSAGKPERSYAATYLMGGTLKLTVDGKSYAMKKQ